MLWKWGSFIHFLMLSHPPCKESRSVPVTQCTQVGTVQTYVSYHRGLHDGIAWCVSWHFTACFVRAHLVTASHLPSTGKETNFQFLWKSGNYSFCIQNNAVMKKATVCVQSFHLSLTSSRDMRMTVTNCWKEFNKMFAQSKVKIIL